VPGRLARLDPRAKVVGLLSVTVVAVSASWDDRTTYATCLAVLAVCTAAGSVSPRELWRRARFVLAPVLAVAAFVPFARGGAEAFALGPLTISEPGLQAFAEVTCKAVIGAFAASLLAATTSHADVVRALEGLRVPRTLTLIGALMVRYLGVLAGEVRRMRNARDARGYAARGPLGALATGRLAGTLFLRSHARGERVHLAMLSRGFDGALPHLDTRALARADVLFLLLVACALVPARLGVIA
jgi:cobalt/nickel transport system permease protein